MKIKFLKLKNIRSYLEEYIEFPDGSLLLSGDVGSGKSTILLAIEFALFGLYPGELSGPTLLRHGKNRGFVEICFYVNGLEITIHREVVRKSKSVVQGNGYIVKNGVRYDMSPTELRYTIFEILGFPKDMLRSHKSLIFRYTVYTPQESIKEILTCDTDFRLSILRKIFGIDKYKNIIENAENLVKDLRSKKKELTSMIEGLEELKEEKLRLEEEKRIILENIDYLENRISDIKNKLSFEEQQLNNLVNESIKVSEARTLVEKNSALLNLKKDQVDEMNNYIEKLQIKITEFEIKLKEIPESREIDIDSLEEKKNLFKRRKDALISETSVLKKEIETLQNILESGVCNTCGQNVFDPKKFLERIQKKETLLNCLKKEFEGIVNKIKDIEEEIEKAKREEINKKRREELEQMIREAKKESENRKTNKERMKKQIQILEESIEKMKALIDPAIEEKVEKQRKKVETLKDEKSGFEKDLAVLREKLKSTNEALLDVLNSIKEKEELKKLFEKVGGYLTWIDEYFIPLIRNVEKHVMITIRHEFNALFQEWFDIIMGGESDIKVSIDESFAPIIFQNNYETEYKNLSGGEKTSVALAYRLALNRVINSLIKTIKTRDLLILDEPTDGFSSEQIENFRQIIEKLSLNQIIIVSHESKIESLVNQTIRIYKEDHVSHVS